MSYEDKSDSPLAEVATEERIEEPAAEEPVEEAKAEPEPEAEPATAAAEEEPTSYAAASSDYDTTSAWEAISKDKNPINWYAVELDKKLDLTFIRAGTGGLKECREFLSSQSEKILFVLLRVNPGDDQGSSRAKFVFIRFIGSTVSVMLKAKAGTVGTKVDAVMPVKHLTFDFSDDSELDKQMSMEQMTKEFLRVGGAHKPEYYNFGPGQTYRLK